jgi:hypothetical protein
LKSELPAQRGVALTLPAGRFSPLRSTRKAFADGEYIGLVRQPGRLSPKSFQAELGQAMHGRHAWLAETEVSEQLYSNSKAIIRAHFYLRRMPQVKTGLYAPIWSIKRRTAQQPFPKPFQVLEKAPPSLNPKNPFNPRTLFYNNVYKFILNRDYFYYSFSFQPFFYDRQ